MVILRETVAKTLAEFVKRYERQALIEAVNRAYEEEPPTPEEKDLVQAIRGQQRKLPGSES